MGVGGVVRSNALNALYSKYFFCQTFLEQLGGKKKIHVYISPPCEISEACIES